MERSPTEHGAAQQLGSHQSLSRLLMAAFHYSRKAFDEAVRPHGVSVSQLAVLNRIADHPGISGVELSRQLFTTPQSVQQMLASLERKGLVERKRDPTSGRIVRSVLTEDGQRVVRDCRANVFEVERQLSSVLQPEERQALIDGLQRYIPHSPPMAD